MGRFDELFEQKYEFRLAQRSDIDAIMAYIDECWKKGHILAKNRDLFEYEFCEGEDVHFLLAIDRTSGEIQGLDGYYYTSSRRTGDFDVWGSMWSVRKDRKNLPMLGIAIANHYYKIIGYRYELGVGVNKDTATPLHQRHFNVATGILNHYYMLNNISTYKIAKIVKPCYLSADINNDSYFLREASDIQVVEKYFSFLDKITTYPYKDGWYVKHRFFDHPVYKYKVMLIMENDVEAEAVIILKDVVKDDRHVIRIVDYMGDISALSGVTNQLYKLMDDTCEYIDFYCFGYDEQEIINAGFVKREIDDENIIPSYFEPFEQRNVDYWFNSDAPENFVICKADADQDRPNIIE
ncbi:MAG: hypothetical protein K6G76_07505 [Lachnospiraceae bacterium]|nr:hypothetical protein [Lachnospiraceae bacterium]